MFVRLVQFTLSPKGRSQAQSMADELVSLIKQQPGCQSAVFYSDTGGVSGLFVLWDSQQHADAAAEIVSPRLEAHLAGNVIAPVERRLLPVLAN